jgi:hypothetical protein
VLPPGANGLANGIQLAAFLTTGQRPPHSDDQLAMYPRPHVRHPGLEPEDLVRFYKDSTFGVKPEDVETTVTPRDDVTIVRDKSFGIPHIYGTTRAGTMFGPATPAAQDRLFFIDVLRHLGRASCRPSSAVARPTAPWTPSSGGSAPYTRPTTSVSSTSATTSTATAVASCRTTR